MCCAPVCNRHSLKALGCISSLVTLGGDFSLPGEKNILPRRSREQLSASREPAPCQCYID